MRLKFGDKELTFGPRWPVIKAVGWSLLAMPRIRRGDLSPLLHTRHVSLDGLKAGHPYVSRCALDANCEDANRLMARPALIEGLQGDESAQEYYVNNRYFSYRSLPVWARQEVIKRLQSRYHSVEK